MKKLLFATCFILAFASCKKEKHGPPPDNPYGLPNATQEGKIFLPVGLMGKIGFRKQGFTIWGGGRA